jgi:hypothetical protein
MSTSRLTPWYPTTIKPVRDGLYQTRWMGRLGWSMWERGRWGNQCDTKENMISKGGARAGEQNKYWRGLNK